ncbi:hypothetical protein ACIA8K_21775 [Catenuloplanes sp. NPDC051500]|uniref:hypothetical protein n=1 Tax=Catenuloplanes sp. NPDC051500 TaxID=3363959 RepID=UPI00379326C0
MFDEWSRRQRGVVARWQALAGGYTRSAIERRLATGRWRRLSSGVYAVSPGPLSRMAELWAAVLAAGSGAMLSHQSAAEVAGLAAVGGPIHVTVPAGRHPQRMPGVVVHRSRRAPWIRRPHRALPQTRVEETVLDLWEASDDLDEALGWVAAACGRSLTSPDRLVLALGQRGRVRRRPELLAVLRDVETGCRSVLELRYLRDVERAHGLPEGERWPCGPPSEREADWGEGVVLYPAFGTSVHLGARPVYPGASARALGELRERVAIGTAPTPGTLRGRVLRYDGADVFRHPCEVADEVAVALHRQGWRRHPRSCSPSCRARTP